jgi:hypothetical protein
VKAPARLSPHGESGSVTAPLLLAVIALCIAIAAGATLIWTQIYAAARISRTPPDATPVASRILELLALDPTPDADSPQDPLATWAGARANAELAIEGFWIRDISSAIDPNWASRALLDQTDFGSLSFKPGADVAALERFRDKEGLSVHIAVHYEALFRPEAFGLYLTGYQPANANTADEHALESIYRQVAPEGDVTAFGERIRQARASGRALRPQDLPAFLAPAGSALATSIVAAPSWNVNYLPETILRPVLRHRLFAVKEPDAAVERIIEARGKAEIVPVDLPGIAGLPPDHPLFQYLGSRTWFWRATWRQDSYECAIVIARLPSREASGSFAIVSLEQVRAGEEEQ